MIVPAATARFGVSSDIDDTELWTNVTNKLNMALMLARANAHTRKPFKGVAAFYRALNQGAGGNEDSPVLYVSSSPWHLFGPLVEFLGVQGNAIVKNGGQESACGWCKDKWGLRGRSRRVCSLKGSPILTGRRPSAFSRR